MDPNITCWSGLHQGMISGITAISIIMLTWYVIRLNKAHFSTHKKVGDKILNGGEKQEKIIQFNSNLFFNIEYKKEVLDS